MPDLDQVPRVVHDRVDVLVGRGDFVEERTGPAPLDALHGRVELGPAERLPGGVAAVLAARAMRRGVEGDPAALPGHHVGAGAHGAGYQSRRTCRRVDGALAGDPHVLPEMLLPRGVGVGEVDRRARYQRLPDPRAQAGDA